MHRALFFGVASPAYLMPFAMYRCGIPAVSCSTLCALACCLFSLLVVFSRCFPLSLSVYSAALLRRSFLWVSLLPIVTGVGPRQQRMLRCRSSSDPPARLCRGESRSGAYLAPLPSCQVGCARAPFLFPFALTHTHSQLSTPLSPSLCLHLFATLPPFPSLSCLLLSPSPGTSLSRGHPFRPSLVFP